MFVLGHLGFGTALTRPWRDRLSCWALLAGMLLPDVIDKPLYYSRLSDFISCTRTFGHTGILMALALVAGVALGRRALVALAVGMATHVFLDCALDVISGDGASSTWRAATWPLLGPTFTQVARMSMAEHAGRLMNVELIVTEILGAGLLWWEVRRKRAS